VTGTVAEFDEHVGLGVVLTSDGSRYPFHCTQIADGSRNIDNGAAVMFVVRERPKGPEAYDIVKE
jgi:cold shock CspA family protein